jgi:hypothetical protein
MKLSELNKIYIAQLQSTPHANPKHRSEKLKARIEKFDQYVGVVAFCPIGKDGKFQYTLFIT